MAYTKEVAIEQIYLLLVGGKPTTQSSVKREDIEPYLLASCQWAWSEDIAERKLNEMRGKRSGVAFTYTEGDIKTAQTLPVTKDTVRNALFVSVPFRIQSYGGQMIWDLFPLEGFEPFYKIQSRTDLAGMDDLLGIKYALLESRSDEQRIYLYGAIVDNVVLEAPFNFNDLKDTDLLPIPAGRELAVIQKCVEYFSIQHGNPINLTVNQNQEGKHDA